MKSISFNNLTPTQARKKAQGLCIAPRCTNKRGKGRNICYKHKARREKRSNPIAYLFNIKKQRAKERGKEWKLTLEEFTEFVLDTGYMDKKGRYNATMTMDRIDSSKGYEVGNLQILSHSENSSKGNRDYSEEDCPF